MMDSATRDAFGKSLLDLALKDEKIVVVSCDLAGATRTKKYAEVYPNRFFEVGIAEQNGISIAAGLALEGFTPIISSFAAFIASRYDQIRISCAYNDANVKIIGTHAGLAIGKDGATQMGTEDINILSALPKIKIFQPADAIETTQILEYITKNKGLSYLRLSRRPLPNIYDPIYRFQFNKASILKTGKDITIFATGDMVYHALKSLQHTKLDPDIINISTLKPIDKETIIQYGKTRKGFITIEDHSIIGGLGSRVCEIVAENSINIPVLRLGLNDCFGESGDPKALYEKYGLSPKRIAGSIDSFYHKIK